MAELALIPIIVSAATGAAIVTPIYADRGMSLWQRFRKWLRYYNCVVRMITKETDGMLFIELLKRISPYCTDLKYTIHISLSFRLPNIEQPLIKPYLLPKAGEYLNIMINNVKLRVLVISLDGIHPTGFEFSCKRRQRHIMDNFVGLAMYEIGISQEDIQRTYPTFCPIHQTPNESKSDENDMLLSRSSSSPTVNHDIALQPIISKQKPPPPTSKPEGSRQRVSNTKAYVKHEN